MDPRGHGCAVRFTSVGTMRAGCPCSGSSPMAIDGSLRCTCRQGDSIRNFGGIAKMDHGTPIQRGRLLLGVCCCMLSPTMNRTNRIDTGGPADRPVPWMHGPAGRMVRHGSPRWTLEATRVAARLAWKRVLIMQSRHRRPCSGRRERIGAPLPRDSRQLHGQDMLDRRALRSGSVPSHDGVVIPGSIGSDAEAQQSHVYGHGSAHPDQCSAQPMRRMR